MKIFIIGITGLLGSEGARHFFDAGHEVSGLTLADYPQDINLPKAIKLHVGSYLQMNDDEIRNLLRGFDGLVFAAGIDERVKTAPPAFDTFNKYNVDPLKQILRIAKEEGIKHTVILGSYFTYFNRTKPALNLAKYHPYIRSRVLQQEVAFSFADESFAVAVLELPYIFGVQPGRKPVWTFLIEMLLEMKGKTYYPQGGSAMVTVRQVGQAISGALLLNEGANAYPINGENVTWDEMLGVMHEAIGLPKRKIVHVPAFLYKLIMTSVYKKDKKAGYEGGLDLGKFSKMHASNQFLPLAPSIALGVTNDDIKAAIYDSAKLSYDVLKNNAKTVGMELEKR